MRCNSKKTSVWVRCTFVLSIAAIILAQDGLARGQAAADNPTTEALSAAPLNGGKYYEAAVPDTLDLAERAAKNINSLIGAADPNAHYETYMCAILHANPPYLSRRSGGPCLPKPVHALALERTMSGSTQGADQDLKMMDGVLRLVEEDGLWWLKSEGRPWDGESYKGDVVCVGQQARLIIALLDWYQYDGNPRWLKVAEKLIGGLKRVAITKEDRAWYFYFLSRSGWKQDPGISVDAMFNRKTPSKNEPAFPDIYSNGLPLRALARWYAATGDQESLDLAGRVARFMMKAFHGPNASEWPSMIDARRQGFWEGHFHSWTMGMIGLTEYAVITNDPDAKRCAKAFYEYARLQGIPRMGFFPAVIGSLPAIRQDVIKGYGEFPGQACEGCGIGDMVWLAVTLSDSGMGDYWEDVDQWVRNQMVEHQWLRRDVLEAIVAGSGERPIDPRMQTTDRVIDRVLGAFGSVSDPTWLYGWYTMCCNVNIPHGMYRAWEAIIEPIGEDAVQVNLLLNRASPWMDVDSYQPYEGMVVLKNKTARRAFVRVPTWADKRAVVCRNGEKTLPKRWLGDYLLVEPLAPRDEVVLNFPMVETTEEYTEKSYDKQYVCRFKGNTLVDISPRGERPGRTVDVADDGSKFPVKKGYPIYLREEYRQDKAPMKRVTRFVASRLINVKAQLHSAESVSPPLGKP